MKYELSEGKYPTSLDWIIAKKGGKEVDRVSVRTCIEHLYGSWRQYKTKNGKIIISTSKGVITHSPKELYEAYMHLKKLSKILKKKKRVDLLWR